MRAGMRRLRWPAPALLAWALAWAVFAGLRAADAAALPALLLATAVGIAASLLAPTWWRRLMVAGGFPLSLALSGAISVSPLAWLLPLGLLLLVYPLNAWRDAPLFPTPPGALDALADALPLPPGAAVLDAGCGLGDGLVALRRAYPQARVHGTEWSWPLRALCALRCPWATVRRDDIWRESWAPFALVYLFQRPESMARAWHKAQAEMAPGAVLVSLDFPVVLAGARPTVELRTPAGRHIWVYRTGT